MRETRRVLRVLCRTVLLLKQDKALPNVASLITGESLSTSWWSHSEAHRIFLVLGELAAHPDVLVVKLLGRKDTLIHRRLWPAILGVAQAREPWQLARLTRPARALLTRLSREGAVQASGPAARLLRERLLVHGWDVHTAAGHHELSLESWEHWARRVGERRALSPEEARPAIEAAVTAIGASPALLPWSKPVRGG